MHPFDLLLVGLLAAMVGLVTATMPRIIWEAFFAPDPPILTPTARRFCQLLYEANRQPGPRLAI